MTVADWWEEHCLKHPDVAEKAEEVVREYGVFRITQEDIMGFHSLDYCVIEKSEEDAKAQAIRHVVENPDEAYCIIPVFLMNKPPHMAQSSAKPDP